LDLHLSKAADEVIEKLGSESSPFSGQKVLITGAAGFLGAHFVHYFLRLNDSGALKSPVKITAVDNFLRGIPPWLEPLKSRKDLEIVTHNIIQPLDWKSWNYVIHGASIASPTFYRKYPLETMDANVIGLRNFLESAVKFKDDVKSFLFFSSSEIYGDPDPSNIPTKEDYRGLVSCTGPRACYDESKRYGETLCVSFWQVHKTPVKTARPFNNYGPGLKITDRRVLPDFFRDVLSGRDIVMMSDGSPTRTFCYITDAISGYLKILLSSHNGEAFNIGIESPEISMRDLAQLVIKITGTKQKLVLGKSQESTYLTDNPQRRCPSIEKARKLLGYNPTVGLEEGLLKTYKYYVDHPTDQDL
jgi:nucleoside-diphosphate-sugar epimerase